jgi:hypothetical protein
MNDHLNMKTKPLLPAKRVISMILGLMATQAVSSIAQTTAFNFNGRLSNIGLPVNGRHDLRFSVYASQAAADLVSGPITVSSVAVKNGVFNCRLDFGQSIFDGSARWLEIGVRPSGTASFTNLSPRVELTSAPYAVRAKEAAVASSVANGTAVKSLNNLKDNVTLAAGPNVTLTPNGNTITIGSTAGGSSGWNKLGNNTYYNSGNVGIGTTNPTSRLEIFGGQDALKLNAYQPVMTFQDSSSANARAAFQSIAGGLSLFTENYLSGVQPFAFMRLDNSGRVGIGAATPQSTLDIVSGQDALRLTGYQPFLTLYDSGSSLAGARIQAANGSIGLMTDRVMNGYGLGQGSLFLQNASGNVGISTLNPQHKLTVVGEGATGFSLGITGNATQDRDKNGFVKAMAYIAANGSVLRSYSAYGGTITVSSNYAYLVTFPFRVNDRYVSVTPLWNHSVGQTVATVEVNCSTCDPNSVWISIWDKDHDVPSGWPIEPKDFEFALLNEFFVFVF